LGPSPPFPAVRPREWGAQHVFAEDNQGQDPGAGALGAAVTRHEAVGSRRVAATR